MKLFKITLLLFLIPLIGFATNGIKHEKSKTIHKSYSVNSNATIFIKNKYGNVSVTTWDKNSVEIDVKITVKGNKLSVVENKLDAITVAFEATKNLIEARTKIENASSGWSSWFGNNNNVNFKINYTVKMPITNNADLHNKYGNIFLDNLKGKATIDCDYGKIEIDKLLNSTNFINLDYCGNSEINYVKSADVNADYSKLTINNAETIKVNLDYTGLKIGTVKTLHFNTDYGNISVDKTDNVIGTSDYAGMRFGTIAKTLKVNTDYGGLRIKNLEKGFENVMIDGNYAGIKIGTHSNTNFNFIVDVNYASFNYPKNNVEVFKSIKKTSKKHYEGQFGGIKSNSNVKIKSSYGSVSIKLID